ncbi:MAG: ATP-binding protein [Gammaproteobacteria bacterium]|nr:ATP-binding protein [Gammaproteobacteria bacterium]
MGWIKAANNIVIFGFSRIGKIHLATASGPRMIELGICCLFTSTTSLAQQL